MSSNIYLYIVIILGQIELCYKIYVFYLNLMQFGGIMKQYMEKDMKLGKQIVWNLPNVLSLIRLLCVPVFLVLFFVFGPNYIPASIVFLFASLTDALDGFLARKMNKITRFGAVLDPLADKMLKISTLFAFAFVGTIEWWLFGILCGIDVTMIIVGFCLFERKITIPSNIIGKTGTLVMTGGLLMCFFPGFFAPWNEYILYIGLGVVASSVILYVAINFDYVKENWAKSKKTAETEAQIEPKDK